MTIFWLQIDQKIINQEKNLRTDSENNPELQLYVQQRLINELNDRIRRLVADVSCSMTFS